MGKVELRKRLVRKLRRDEASILTDAEVQLLAAEMRRLLGPAFAEVTGISGFRLGDTVRWLSLKARCEQARADRGLSLKEAAVAFKVPRYRLAAVEAGARGEFKPEIARRYFQFLGIEPWVRRWSRANPRIARRVGIAPEGRVAHNLRAKSRRTTRGKPRLAWDKIPG